MKGFQKLGITEELQTLWGTGAACSFHGDGAHANHYCKLTQERGIITRMALTFVTSPIMLLICCNAYRVFGVIIIDFATFL